MQRARSMLRCSLFSLIEGKVTTVFVSFQTFPHFSLQLIATARPMVACYQRDARTLPSGDKPPKQPQNLSPDKKVPWKCLCLSGFQDGRSWFWNCAGVMSILGTMSTTLAKGGTDKTCTMMRDLLLGKVPCIAI